jgi:hypothetical protein
MHDAPNHYRSDMSKLSQLLIICTICLLSACSPKYNWREVHGNSVPFTILLPGKSDAFTQSVVLNGVSVAMTMTATEVDGITFAVGTASFADAAAAQNALDQMKMALIRNIDGKPADVAVPGKEIAGTRALSFSAAGVSRGKPLQMTARLYSIERRVYQVLMVGDPKKMQAETTETFFTSFKPD